MTIKPETHKLNRTVTRALSLRRQGAMALALFLVAAFSMMSKVHASVPLTTKTSQHTEISLRTSGIYAEIFELAMDAYRERNYAAAIHLWQPIAESGYAPAQYNLGVVHARGLAVHKDMNQAGRWWQAAADQGNVDAQYNLGLLYATGNGVELNMKKAVLWWQQAATTGDPAAQFNLGMMYARGDGVSRNMDAAMHWWEQSAAQQFPKAQEILHQLSAVQ
jgi:TPR repeat protein